MKAHGIVLPLISKESMFVIFAEEQINITALKIEVLFRNLHKPKFIQRETHGGGDSGDMAKTMIKEGRVMVDSKKN